MTIFNFPYEKNSIEKNSLSRRFFRQCLVNENRELKIHEHFAKNRQDLNFSMVTFPLSTNMEFGPNDNSPIQFTIEKDQNITIVCHFRQKEKLIDVLGFYAQTGALESKSITTVADSLLKHPADSKRVRDTVKEVFAAEEEIEFESEKTNFSKEENPYEEEEFSDEASLDIELDSKRESAKSYEDVSIYIFNSVARPQKAGMELVREYSLKRARLLKNCHGAFNAIKSGRQDFSRACQRVCELADSYFPNSNDLSFEMDIVSSHIVCLAFSRLPLENNKHADYWMSAEKFLLRCRLEAAVKSQGEEFIATNFERNSLEYNHENTSQTVELASKNMLSELDNKRNLLTNKNPRIDEIVSAVLEEFEIEH